MGKIKEKMVLIARQHNVFVSIGTIHRWANEPDFPRVAGRKGKYFLYFHSEYTNFLHQRIRKM